MVSTVSVAEFVKVLTTRSAGVHASGVRCRRSARSDPQSSGARESCLAKRAESNHVGTSLREVDIEPRFERRGGRQSLFVHARDDARRIVGAIRRVVHRESRVVASEVLRRDVSTSAQVRRVSEPYIAVVLFISNSAVVAEARRIRTVRGRERGVISRVCERGGQRDCVRAIVVRGRHHATRSTGVRTAGVHIGPRPCGDHDRASPSSCRIAVGSEPNRVGVSRNQGDVEAGLEEARRRQDFVVHARDDGSGRVRAHVPVVDRESRVVTREAEGRDVRATADSRRVGEPDIVVVLLVTEVSVVTETRGVGAVGRGSGGVVRSCREG